jgi:hypothetical protein
MAPKVAPRIEVSTILQRADVTACAVPLTLSSGSRLDVGAEDHPAHIPDLEVRPGTHSRNLIILEPEAPPEARTLDVCVSSSIVSWRGSPVCSWRPLLC